MSINNLTNHIDELSDNIQAYINSTLEYYKLDAFKKVTRGSSIIIRLLIIGSVFLLFLGFISVGFSILIGESIGHLSYGFFIVGGVYFLIFILLLLYGKNLFNKLILEKASKIVFNESTLKDVVDEPLESELHKS